MDKRKQARSKTWFGLPVLFVLGRQRSQRKEPPNDLLGEKITSGWEKNGTGIAGSDSSGSGVRKHNLFCRKAATENLGLAPRPAFPFLSFLAILNFKKGITHKKGTSPGSTRKPQWRGD